MFGARLKIIRPAATDLLLLSLAGRHDSKPSSSNRFGSTRARNWIQEIAWSAYYGAWSLNAFMVNQSGRDL
jgi:hypothetical protein